VQGRKIFFFIFLFFLNSGEGSDNICELVSLFEQKRKRGEGGPSTADHKRKEIRVSSILYIKKSSQKPF